MQRYDLARQPRIVGGAGVLGDLGPLAAELAPKAAPVLLVADPGLIHTGLVDDVRASLIGSGFGVSIFSDLTGDPSIAQTDAAVSLARSVDAAIIVSLGGGSALDLGKTVAGLAIDGSSAATFALGAVPLPSSRLRSIAIPTTSGTGAELTRTAVLSRADKSKVWLWGQSLQADLVLLDPAATASLPAHLTAATGIDALVHAIEATTNANASRANDIFAHEAIRLAVRHLEAAVAEGSDLQARDGMQRAAALAGIAIDNAGTAIAHTIGHALASLRPIHHGLAVAKGMMASLPWNVAAGDGGRFAAVAALMGEAGGAAALPAAFTRLCRAVGIEPGLGPSFADIAPEALARQMAMPENAAMRRSNRRPSTDADLLMFARHLLTPA